jgi:hypothetical protein
MNPVPEDLLAAAKAQGCTCNPTYRAMNRADRRAEKIRVGKNHPGYGRLWRFLLHEATCPLNLGQKAKP